MACAKRVPAQKAGPEDQRCGSGCKSAEERPRTTSYFDLFVRNERDLIGREIFDGIAFPGERAHQRLTDAITKPFLARATQRRFIRKSDQDGEVARVLPIVP